jgi:hypothetical protein
LEALNAWRKAGDQPSNDKKVRFNDGAQVENDIKTLEDFKMRDRKQPP